VTRKRYGVGHKKAPAPKADWGRIERHSRPLLGKTRTDHVGRADIKRMRNALATGKIARKIVSGEKRDREASQSATMCRSSWLSFAIGQALARAAVLPACLGCEDSRHFGLQSLQIPLGWLPHRHDLREDRPAMPPISGAIFGLEIWESQLFHALRAKNRFFIPHLSH
jgi:hypothetical protein